MQLFTNSTQGRPGYLYLFRLKLIALASSQFSFVKTANPNLAFHVKCHAVKKPCNLVFIKLI